MHASDDLALERDSDVVEVSDEVKARCRARAKRMLTELKKVNPKQHAMVVDQSPHISGLCPRRAGKSYGGAAAALIAGEANPGNIALIISLNKQQLRRIYWSGGPSGLYMLSRKYDLNLTFHSGFLRWEHENGSIGYLLGCEDDEQLEVIRGLEADLYLIDECKSFAPAKLDKLIDQVIDPQRESRKGRLMLIGTPGFIASGPFYQATCLASKDVAGMPYALPFGEKDPWGRTPEGDLLWSLHTWTLQENTAKPEQWIGGLRKKKNKKWADDHPIWLREYLGQWTATSDGLVFNYAAEKSLGRCTWNPERTDDNPSGLPQEGAPWRLIAGLDFGYEAPTAMVVCGYSMKSRELRHIWDFSGRHMLPREIASMIQRAQDKYGRFEMIYADVGNLGKTIAMELQRDYGLPIERAEKREKFDYIEQLNDAFSQGELLIIPGTTLETQLLTNAWDLDEVDDLPNGMSAKENMGRLGKLVEDKNIPNDSTDALLYLFRGSLHRFGKTKKEAEVTPGTAEWFRKWEKDQLAQARAAYLTPADARMGSNKMINLPRGLRDAFKKKDPWSHSTLINSAK